VQKKISEAIAFQAKHWTHACAGARSLHFALPGDDEFIALSQQAADENLSAAQIKAAIKKWRAGLPAQYSINFPTVQVR
jgi:hypothetical protein